MLCWIRPYVFVITLFYKYTVGTVGCISGKPFFCWNRLAGVDRSQIVNVYVAYSKGLRDSVNQQVNHLWLLCPGPSYADKTGISGWFSPISLRSTKSFARLYCNCGPGIYRDRKITKLKLIRRKDKRALKNEFGENKGSCQNSLIVLNLKLWVCKKRSEEMSNSLTSLRGNERSWANRSHRSPKQRK